MGAPLEMEQAQLFLGPCRAQAFENEPLVKLKQLWFDRILDQLLFIAALFKPSLFLSPKWSMISLSFFFFQGSGLTKHYHN